MTLEIDLNLPGILLIIGVCAVFFTAGYGLAFIDLTRGWESSDEHSDIVMHILQLTKQKKGGA